MEECSSSYTKNTTTPRLPLGGHRLIVIYDRSLYLSLVLIGSLSHLEEFDGKINNLHEVKIL
jgi:hypothetical protein